MGGRLHRTRVGLAAVLLAVLAIVLLLVVPREGSVGSVVGGLALVAWTLWPALLLFERPRWWRYHAEGAARTVGIVLGCIAGAGWTAIVTSSDSSTSALGFIWSPLWVLAATLIPYGALRGPRLSPAAPPEDGFGPQRARREVPHDDAPVA